MRTPDDPPRRRILVADDDQHTRNLLRDLCETAGYEVVQATDGVQATAMIEAQPPDLVLLDLVMPGKDGFSVLRDLRESTVWADIPVIIITSMGDMDGKIRGMELGADDFVTKPFKLIELQTRISSALTVREYRKKLMAAEEELALLRAVDPITGAGTYAQLKVSLDAEIARSRRYGRPASALLCGFDDYQGMRYQMGREKCDELIASMAKALRGTLRGADRLFRLDVDEFVILMPETDLHGAQIAARRLAGVANRLQARGRNGPVEIKVRFGGAVFPHDRVRSSEDLLREANRTYTALREADPDQVVFDVP